MTQAICLKCGSMKFGAFCPCQKCGFEPRSEEDTAQSMLLSDHFMDKQELLSVGHAISEGLKIVFPSGQIEEVIAVLKKPPAYGHSGKSKRKWWRFWV